MCVFSRKAETKALKKIEKKDLSTVYGSEDENNFQVQEIDFQNGIDEDDA